MVIRINPSHQALWRTPFEMQLGLGAESVVLKKLSPAQERLIAALYQGIANQQLPTITKELGLDKAESDSVLAKLGPILLADAPKSKSKIELNPEFVASAFSEIIRASLLHSVDGEAVLIGRASRSVHLEDLSRTGLTISQGLAAAGIGHLISHDEQVVNKTDLGPTGYPSQLIGRPRVDGLRTILAASPNKTMVSTGKKLLEKQLQKIDCAVLIAQQVIDPRRYAKWLEHNVPHISVTFDSEHASVSPMIIPGQTACLFCLEKMRTEQDPNWPVLASQLIASQKKFDDVASQLFVSGVVIQKILTRLDKVAGFELSEENLSGYQMNLKSGAITELLWPKHPTCDCKAATS